MTALKREVIQLVEQMPYVIQYIHTLKSKDFKIGQIFESKHSVTPKMEAFQELEKMIVPI